MFDIGWQELLVIGALALIVVGPKDLPGMLHKLGQMVGRLRSMASEFQSAMHDAAREADISNFKELNEARDAFSGTLDFSDDKSTSQSTLDMNEIDEDIADQDLADHDLAAAAGAGPDDDPAGGPITTPVDITKPAPASAEAEPPVAETPVAADQEQPAKAAGT